MALLIFPPEKLAPPLAALLNPNLRKEVAKKVNEAIHESQGERTKARLFDLVRLRAWAEAKARDGRRAELPEKIELGLDPPRQQGLDMQGNGEGDAMVT